jgi:predicted phosphodiesterase
LTLEAGARLCLIADIHSNLPALEAVLTKVTSTSPILCMGDLTGYYLEPNEVCERLRSISAICIKGNHDKYVLEELDYPASREEKYRVIANRLSLTAENRQWLAALPDAVQIEVLETGGGGRGHARIHMAHGSPRSIEEYIYPDTPIDFLETDEPEMLVLGHTHHPMTRQAGALTIINPGSVGQARDRMPGACYAMLDPFSRSLEFHRAIYDVAGYQQRLIEEGVQQSMVQILSRSD